MSILIKGMKMPKNCAECPLNHDAECYLFDRLVCDDPYTHKSDWCPLVEVHTPHGRLIDADVAYDCIAEEDHAGNYVDMDSVGRGIENTPTVIEAEDGT